MKKAVIIVLCVAILAGGGVFGWQQYQKSRDESTVVDVVPVKILAQPYDNFMWYGSEMSGNIQAANAQRVYIDTNKLVQTVCVRKGQSVKKGDTILEYDMTVVELQLEQKENEVAVVAQNIKMANKKLAEIKRYRPSEERPPEPDYPDLPDYPDDPDDPDFPPDPVEPVETVPELGGVFQPVSGTGTPEDPFVLNCSLSTVVRRTFMAAVASSHRCAELRVYDENSSFLYKWVLNGSTMDPAAQNDWLVTDGLLVDTAAGTVSIDPNGKLNGILSFALPAAEPDIPADDEPAFFAEPAPVQTMAQPRAFDDFGDDGNMDYVYSRAEIARLVKQQEAEIKELELELKSKQLELEAAKKRKSDGRVVAELDGVVKKIGTASGEETEPDDEEKDPFAEPDPDDNAFALIEGDGGIEVAFRVSELNLPNFTKGTKVNVMSYRSGGQSEAEITGVDETPVAYEVQNWGDSPNNSTYMVHAKLTDTADFTVGSWVSVTMGENKVHSNSVYLPIHYVRQEGGDYYVMKVDENDRLIKQYIRAGQVMYSYIEVSGGLDFKDKIAFPYGNDVKEGARTSETNEILYPDNYYY